MSRVSANQGAQDWDAQDEAALVRSRFLSAIDHEQRAEVVRRLGDPSFGGGGLRAWMNGLAHHVTELPARLSCELVQVYLDFSDAMPAHECESCGLAIPVIPSQSYGFESEGQRLFFPDCPHCGGRTGPNLHALRPAPRRPKPR